MAETILSAEVRWFWKGKAPESVSNVFKKVPEDKFEKREDLYLHILSNKGRDDLGVKARGGNNVEIKLRHSRDDCVELSSFKVDNVATWIKWSLSTGEDKHGLDKLLGRGRYWIRTIKNRKLRKFGFKENIVKLSNIEELDEVPQGDVGCSVELTMVNIDSRDTWETFGFEAFGAENDEKEKIVDTLRKTLIHILEVHNLSELDLNSENYYSYPEWLRRI